MPKNIFGKSSNYLGDRTIETPFEAGISAAKGVQNVFANQLALNKARREQEGMNALQQEMGGMDMKNPNYARIFANAPDFALKFMRGMTELNEQQRLEAVNRADAGTKLLKTALPGYALNPSVERRDAIRSALKSVGMADEVIAATVPDFTQFSDYESFNGAIMGGLDVAKYLTGVNEEAKQRFITERERLKIAGKQQYVETQVKGMETTSAAKVEAAKLGKQGQDVAASSRVEVAKLNLQKKKNKSGEIPTQPELSKEKIEKDYANFVAKYPDRAKEAAAYRDELLEGLK